MRAKIKWYFYLTFKLPAYKLIGWFRLQRDIYKTPREQRPLFWEMRAKFTQAKVEMSYDIGETLYGSYQSQKNPKEFNGLGVLISKDISNE